MNLDMAEAMKRAAPMRTRDDLAEALRQIEPLRPKDKSRERDSKNRTDESDSS